MVGDITLVAQDNIGLVALGTAPLADGAVQAAPTLLKDHFCYLKTKKGLKTGKVIVLKIKL